MKDVDIEMMLLYL